jgi:hypothetical protein
LHFWVSIGHVGVLNFLFEGFEELLDSGFLDIAWAALILETFTNVVLNDFLKWIFQILIRDSTGIVLDLLHSWVVRWCFLSFGQLEVCAEHSSQLSGPITCSTLLICQLHLWIWHKHVFVWLVEALLLGISCNAVTIFLLFCNLSFWSGAVVGNLKWVRVRHIILVLLRLLVLHILIWVFINLI